MNNLFKWCVLVHIQKNKIPTLKHHSFNQNFKKYILLNIDSYM